MVDRDRERRFGYTMSKNFQVDLRDSYRQLDTVYLIITKRHRPRVSAEPVRVT
jgi:hypothetical protein